MLAYFKAEITRKPVWVLTLITAFLSLFFYLFPQLDLALSSLFYAEGEKFFLRWLDFPQSLRRMGIFIPRALVVLLVLFLIARLFWPHLEKVASLSKVLFLAIGAALGPGLVVNLILKSHWGRARPSQTDIFGGPWPYSKVWEIAGNCQENCSFVSGEGAMAFWMVMLVLIIPTTHRRWAGWCLGLFGLAISFNRILFGGHYLSDIVLSWAITAWIMAVLWHVFFIQPPSWLEEQKLQTAWARLGQRLQKPFRKQK